MALSSTCRLRLRVTAGAGRSEVVGRYDESAWRIRVGAPPERGKANRALIRFLSDLLGVERSRIGIVTGTTARDKVLEIEGAKRSEVERALAAAARRR